MRRLSEIVLIVEGYRATDDELSPEALRTLVLLLAELPLKKPGAGGADPRREKECTVPLRPRSAAKSVKRGGGVISGTHIADDKRRESAYTAGRS